MTLPVIDPSQIASPVSGAVPSADVLGGNQADRIANAAQNVQTQPTPTQPTPAPTPPPDKHALLGRVVSHIKHAVEGTQTSYVPDTTEDGRPTGGVREVVGPRKPGGIFRDIFSGMLSGMAAASMNTEHPSGAAGLGLGFMGARDDAQAQQDRARQQAQGRANAAVQKQKVLDDQQLAAASVATDMMNSLQLGHFVPHFTDEEIGDYNNSQSALKDVLLKNGAQLAEVDDNGERGNGPSLMQNYVRDNSLMVAPDGYHRVASISYDTSGLQHAGHQWVDPKTGKQPTDWNDRATVSLIDVPNSSWGKPVTLPGRAIRDIAPNLQLVKDPSRNYSTSVGSLFALGLKNKSQMLAARNELYRAPQNEQEALALQSEAKQINSDPNAPADLKRRAAIKGPLADNWLAAQAAQKRAMEEAGQRPAGAPKTLAESAIARANAQFAYDKSPTPENKQALDAASAAYQGAANSKKDELDAEYRSQLRLAAGRADAERKAKEQYDRNLYAAMTAGDPLGWVPKPNQFMTEQQFNSAKEKFGSGALTKAQDVEKSYQMFQDAYGDYKAANGELPTGAQSMLALSTHLSTTFGNVKGSRVTKDMIREHLGARSISDDALVSVQKLTSGDVLSPKQWKAFNDLISDSRNKTWDNTVNNAHYLGLPADFVPLDYAQANAAPTQQSSGVPNRTPGQSNTPASQSGNHPFFQKFGGKAD